MNISKAFSLTKPGIAVLIDLVALTTFILGLKDASMAWKVIPLLASGTLASFSSSLCNNFFDADIDGKMSRTRWRSAFINRKLYISSILILLISSLLISLIFLNLATTVWILCGFLSYSILYTVILKRRTQWNIVIGGIAGSFPALAGWSSVNSPYSLVSIFVAVIVFLWTPTHFWTLAIKYRDDYSSANIPMLPSVRDESFTVRAIILNTVVLIAFSFSPLILGIRFPSLYYLLLIPISAYLIARVIMLEFRKRELKEVSFKAFLASNYYLSFFLFILVLTAVRF
ncbi:MAG: heme o synthase [Thermoplasmatales archaeon]